MNRELERKLINNYPGLFDDLDWGFECGDGWFNLIAELAFNLKKFDIKAEQVKEKFGTLRFYWTGNVNDEEAEKIEQYVNAATQRSWGTCEICGKSGERLGSPLGIIKILCNECAKNHN